MLCAVSGRDDYVAFAWTSKGDLWHIMSPVALVPPWGEYYPRLCTREQFEKLVFVDVLLEQEQGGRALASNSYSYGGHFVHSLRLGTGNPISFTASVSPESEFVCWQFYRGDESQPFLTVDKTRVDLHWTQAANAVARVVTRPKDEYKLLLETKVADPGTPGEDCPGYVVVEDARTIGTLSYHGPKRYYPKDGWVRIRPVANPGYRFVRWETGEDVQGAVLGPLGIRTEKDLNGLEEETIAVCMEDDTVITAVFEWAPNPGVSRENGIVTLFSESEEDQALLERADFDPDDDELSRWLKTEASPGEIFKLTVSNPAELSACGVEPSWDWSHEGAHIAGIQPDSSGIAGVAGDVCYVEAKNEYVPADPPIGILRIRVAGGQRILKTIVVEYGDVKEYKLNVTVHDSLPVQESAVREWFETATSSAFLLDELLPPDHQKLRGGGTLKQRLEDTKDVNCPVALCLESFSRFGDADVTQGAEQDVYFDIDSGKEDEAIDGAWANGKHIIIVNRVLYHDGIEYETPIAFAAKSGYSYTPVHQIVLSAANEDGFNLAHEFGHYAGNLDDTYICGNPGHQEWPPDPGCGGQGRDGCICRCPQEALGRRACMCGHKFPHFYPPLENPYNLMSNRKRSAAVLRFQCDALVNGGH